MMVDNKSEGLNGGASLNVDLDAIRLAGDANDDSSLGIKLINELFNHPGSVIQLSHIEGDKFGVKAQGTSLDDMMAKVAPGTYPSIIAQSDGSYTIGGNYNGIPIYLDAKTTRLATALGGTTSNSFWLLLPINFTDNYIGIKPEIRTDDGNYWGTFYASFSYKLHSVGMEAYYVNAMNDESCTLKQLADGIVPAGMPVLIKCVSGNPSDNMIEPLTTSGSIPDGNKLSGVYFDNTTSNHFNSVTYNETTMRVLGTHNGGLAFVKPSADYLTEEKYLPHNKCHLVVSASAGNILPVSEVLAIHNTETEEQPKQKGTYTLTGLKISDEITPKPGIYIRNGQKIVIK